MLSRLHRTVKRKNAPFCSRHFHYPLSTAVPTFTHMRTFDVLVIGGGIAGTAAALAAARAGARTAVVRRGPGATALASGCWIDEPPAELRTALADAGLDLTACKGALPHPDGELVHCAVAPVSHAHAALTSGAERVLVCGIAGLGGFHPRALAKLWADAAALDDAALEPFEVILPDTPAAGWAPLSLAAAIEREPRHLAAAIAHSARERGVARAIVPAVLGLDTHARVHTMVEQHAGVMIGEALGTAPSIPGWRLDRALMQTLLAANIDLIEGLVADPVARASTIESVTVVSGTRSETISARAYVLATGKFIGGGITAEQRFEESALGCDVALERFGRTFDDPAAALVLTDPVRTEPQPVLALGIVNDDDARPLRASGEVCFQNVFAAGAVCAGTMTAALGLGAAADDGWRAGARAAKVA